MGGRGGSKILEKDLTSFKDGPFSKFNLIFLITNMLMLTLTECLVLMTPDSKLLGYNILSNSS